MNTMVEPASSPSAASIAAADLLADPVNRIYRYPFCEKFLRWLEKTPIEPNHITTVHLILGVSSGWFIAQGDYRGLLIGFVIYELRNILDCADGLLARWKQSFSTLGRHYDGFADGLAFSSLLIGGGFYIHRVHPDMAIVPPLLSVALVTLFCANFYDFYRRKLMSALKDGRDDVEFELVEAQKRKRNIFLRVGIVADLTRVKLCAPKEYYEHLKRRLAAPEEESTRRPDVDYLIANAHQPNVKRMLVATSLLGGDNALFIVNIGMLTNHFVLGLWVATAYSLVAMFTATVIGRRTLRETYGQT